VLLVRIVAGVERVERLSKGAAHRRKKDPGGFMERCSAADA
jgi:hypothetical protein